MKSLLGNLKPFLPGKLAGMTISMLVGKPFNNRRFNLFVLMEGSNEAKSGAATK